MKTKKHWTLITLIISCVLFFFLMDNVDSAETESPEFSTTVKLRINADEDLKNSIYSYISRELRSLSDVKIVEKNAKIVISIVATESVFTDGTQAGTIAISAVISEPSTFYEILKDRIGKSEYELLKVFCENQEFLKQIYIFTCPEIDVQKICQKIAVNFDIDILEPSRKLHQGRQEFFKSLKRIRNR